MPNSTTAVFFEKNWKIVILLLVLLQLFIRYSVSNFPYSGEFTPPKYGDFEAQRHWLEVTSNLPVLEWYKNSTQNDLSWWGLDYPPLTAYHSWLLGKIAHWVEPSSVALVASHGYQSALNRLYMRTTVIVSELLVYATALVCYVFQNHKDNRFLHIFVMLSQPCLLLIDHGHFHVCLGLALWGVVLLGANRVLLGSIAFCLALNFKQVSLYFAPAFFFYILGLNFKNANLSIGVKRTALVGVVVIGAFVVCWLPFILGGQDSVLMVLHRIFPIQRGLYEDKVANFWCSVAPVIKFKDFQISAMTLICAVTTLALLLPSGLSVLIYPTFKNFVLTLFASAMSFFLFSFHVHEKSILFALLPATLLLPARPQFSLWMQITGLFSVFHLSMKDENQLAYFILLLYFLIVASLYCPDLFQSRKFQIYLICIAVIHAIQACLTPPAKLPYLFVILNTTFAFVNFVAGFLYVNYVQWTTNWTGERGFDRTKHD